MPGESKVCILMCTYNGGRFLREQLDSFLAQTHKNWELHVSDDGSSDDTTVVLEAFREENGGGALVEGPRAGFAANFLNLTRCADTDASYFAWSDQDDVWLPDKLARAVSWLSSVPEATPALYCARTQVVDADRRRLGLSAIPTHELGFANALAQNIAGGNTMVFNRAARLLLQEGEQPIVVAHDWWIYQLVAGSEGFVHFDSQPVLLYRQHGGNELGENVSFIATMRRGVGLLKGVYSRRDDINITALQSRRHLLSPDNAAIFALFVQAKKMKNPFRRLVLLRRSGVLRHSRLHSFAFQTATLLGLYP